MLLNDDDDDDEDEDDKIIKDGLEETAYQC